MQVEILKTADIFFIVLHTAIIVFNLFGWICIKTRKANLFLLLLTGASWFLLGLFYGIGYCPLTDWHFQVLLKLGNTNIPASYIKYLIDRFFGTDINAGLVDMSTLIFYIGALLISAILNLRDRGKRRRKKSNII